MNRIRKTFIQAITMLLTSSLLSSCLFVAYSKPIQTKQTVTPQMAYVFGRFKETRKHILNLSIRLQNLQSKKFHYIRLREKQPVFAVALPPGRYKITGFMMAKLSPSFMGLSKSDYQVMEVKQAALKQEFSIGPGKLYYLGDYYGYTTQSQIYRTIRWTGRIEKFKWNLNTTSDELLKQNSGYSQLKIGPAWPVFSKPLKKSSQVN